MAPNDLRIKSKQDPVICSASVAHFLALSSEPQSVLWLPSEPSHIPFPVPEHSHLALQLTNSHSSYGLPNIWLHFGHVPETSKPVIPSLNLTWLFLPHTPSILVYYPACLLVTLWVPCWHGYSCPAYSCLSNAWYRVVLLNIWRKKLFLIWFIKGK